MVRLLQPNTHAVFILDEDAIDVFATIESDGGDVFAYLVDEENLAKFGNAEEFIFSGSEAAAKEHEIYADLEDGKKYFIVTLNENEGPIAVQVDIAEDEDDEDDDEDGEDEDDEEEEDEANAGG